MIHPFSLLGIHHAAYRCKDAKETVDFYAEALGMTFTTAFAEDRVPSTGEFDPYMHVFLDAGGGNVLAFFELPAQPSMGHDPNTPTWVQHIALKVGSLETLETAKVHIQGMGVDVVGPTDHGVFQSIYFFDPKGHRLELTADTGSNAEMQELKRVAPLMLEEWSRTKKAPQHAAWLHEKHGPRMRRRSGSANRRSRFSWPGAPRDHRECIQHELVGHENWRSQKQYMWVGYRFKVAF